MRRAAVIASLVLVAFALVVVAFGGREAVVAPAFVALIVGCVLVARLLSAYVLFAEFAGSGLVLFLFVAAAYVVTALLTVPYVLAFPGVFGTPAVGAARTVSYVWIAWHIAFPLTFVTAIVVGRVPYDLRVDRTARRRLIGITIAACVLAACVAPVLWQTLDGRLPEIARDGTFFPATAAVVAPLVLAFDVFAIGVLFTRTRLRTAIFVWLFLAVVASGLDTVTGLVSPQYSYGWYAGQVLVLISSCVLLVGFLRETRSMQVRLARSNEDLRIAREREHHLAQERLHRLARYDDLTGVANRTQLHERLNEQVGGTQPTGALAVFFISLDGFMHVNEQFGRGAADGILAEIATRIAAAARRDDIVARYGGDEFVVLAPAVASAERAHALADAIRERIAEPVDVPGGSARIGASVGVALYPSDGASAATVLDSADAAARHAKRTGGNRTSLYSADLFEEARARRRLHDDLSLALLHDQFVLHYQPIVNLLTGEVVKVEALIRWSHPSRGLLPPCDFIPAAEETGLMQLIGYWVIEEAVRQACAWDDAGAALRVAVNVSARQLDDPGFLAHLTRTIEDAGIYPPLLELEITESAAMTDASVAEHVLAQCRAIGLSIALDDFGTYYSSLTYLKRLPIDTVKIDRSFVQGLPSVQSDVAIVSGVLGLARALERSVVAEGIETEQQRAWLARAGCEFGQGYAIARPMTSAALSDWRRSRERA